jgi:hypothetical protein
MPELSSTIIGRGNFELRGEITHLPPMRWSSEKAGMHLPSFCGDLTPRELWVRAP